MRKDEVEARYVACVREKINACVLFVAWETGRKDVTW
jgi:hypothetical protein